MTKLIAKFTKDEEGAALIEYTILLGVIAVAVVASAIWVGGWITPRWTALTAALAAAP